MVPNDVNDCIHLGRWIVLVVVKINWHPKSLMKIGLKSVFLVVRLEEEVVDGAETV